MLVFVVAVVASLFIAPAGAQALEGYPHSCPEGSVYGTNGPDTLTGTEFADLIFGEGGDDNIAGLGGNDCLFGDNGADSILGGGGEDLIAGGNGPDFLNGQDGADYVYGDAGGDSIQGGSGGDYLFGGPGRDLILGQTGNDTIYAGDDGVLSGQYSAAQKDNVDCGPGNYDVAYVDHLDIVVHCEYVYEYYEDTQTATF
jgi:Ca2+-binding RTX toxin-like protein